MGKWLENHRCNPRGCEIIKTLRKGQVYEMEITGLSHEGEGVGRVDGIAVFVPDAIPSDIVTARCISVKKTYGRALVERVVRPSPYRQEPACPVYARCGGCPLQHMSYPEQLRWKGQQVADALQRIGGLPIGGTVI